MKSKGTSQRFRFAGDAPRQVISSCNFLQGNCLINPVPCGGRSRGPQYEGEIIMTKVLMRCPTKGNVFDTGVDCESLSNLGLRMAECPHCHQHHYLRLPYFENETPRDELVPQDGLETAPAFAMEVGIIVAGTAFMEMYIPLIFSKITGASDAHAITVFGAFPGTGQKIKVLEILRDVREKGSDIYVALGIISKKMRKCSEIRNYYAHAKYSYGGGNTISIIPYFADSAKRTPPVDPLPISKLTEDAQFIRKTKHMIGEYIREGTRPAQ